MINLPLTKRFVLAPSLLIIVMVMLTLNEPHSISCFGFYPDKIINGDYWRLFIGQLLHTNNNHLMLNIGGLALVWALHGQYYSPRHFLLILFTSLFFIGVSLTLFADYQHYAGLSGVLHTFFIYGAFIDVRRGDKTGWLLLLGVIAKVSYELTFGAAAETERLINAKVAVEAHLAGVLIGGILGIIYLLKSTTPEQNNNT